MYDLSTHGFCFSCDWSRVGGLESNMKQLLGGMGWRQEIEEEEDEFLLQMISARTVWLTVHM